MTLPRRKREIEPPPRVLRQVPDGLDDPLSIEIGALKQELQATRAEFQELRTLFLERERKGLLLMDAYKTVISDFTNLFELVQTESSKREESVRFLLSAIEARITDLLRPDSVSGARNVEISDSQGWFSRRHRKR